MTLDKAFDKSKISIILLRDAGSKRRSIDLLHLGVGVGGGGVNKRREVLIGVTLDIVDGQTNLDHSVDAGGKLRGVLEVEA